MGATSCWKNFEEFDGPDTAAVGFSCAVGGGVHSRWCIRQLLPWHSEGVPPLNQTEVAVVVGAAPANIQKATNNNGKQTAGSLPSPQCLCNQATKQPSSRSHTCVCALAHARR